MIVFLLFQNFISFERLFFFWALINDSEVVRHLDHIDIYTSLVALPVPLFILFLTHRPLIFEDKFWIRTKKQDSLLTLFPFEPMSPTLLLLLRRNFKPNPLFNIRGYTLLVLLYMPMDITKLFSHGTILNLKIGDLRLIFLYSVCCWYYTCCQAWLHSPPLLFSYFCYG